MAAKTDPINTSNPVGTSDPKQGDNYIRALARALIEFLGVDHYVGAANPWGSDASGDETGEHKKVTFHEAISDPTVAAGDGIMYIKGDPPELYFRDEDDGNVIQLTSGGDLYSSAGLGVSGDTVLSGAATITGVLTTTAASVLGDGSTLAAATEAGDGDRTIADKAYADGQTLDSLGAGVSKNKDTNYTAATSGFLVVMATDTWDYNVIHTIVVKSDDAATPTTVVGKAGGKCTRADSDGNIVYHILTVPILKDKKYRVEDTGAVIDSITFYPNS